MTYYRDKTFDGVLLGSDQKQLLEVLVEAARRTPREKRQKFTLMTSASRHLAMVLHAGLATDFPGAYEGDFEALVAEKLLRRSRDASGEASYDITPLGFKYYEHLQEEKGAPVFRQELAVRSYIETDTFRNRFPDAYSKWTDAERLLWSADSESQLTAIGHHCREALQLFADTLVRRESAEVAADKAKTVTRLRAVLAARVPSGGVREHLEALVTYFGSLSDLAQRQEHGALKEREGLTWEDGRRLVFLTMVALTEVDRAIPPQ